MAATPPLFVINAALKLRSLLLRAADRVVPPYLAVLDRMQGTSCTMVMHAAARLRIADVLAASGPLTSAELAQRVGLPEAGLDRLMFSLEALGFFSRDAEGRHGMNYPARGLLTGAPGSARGFAEFFGSEALLRAWADFDRSLQTGECAFDRVHARSVWDWMDAEEGPRRAFVEGMSAITEFGAPGVAAAYPFHRFGRLCDVGGGSGAQLAAILQAHPRLNGVLFDSQAMLDEAPPRLKAAGVSDRVTLTPGSFFDTVPAGADAYLFKTVLHNWDDARALRILRNVRAAMPAGKHVLAVDFLRGPESPGTLVPFMDLLGMCFFSGRERTREDMAALYREAGFRLDDVVPVPGSMAIFEGVAV